MNRSVGNSWIFKGGVLNKQLIFLPGFLLVALCANAWGATGTVSITNPKDDITITDNNVVVNGTYSLTSDATPRGYGPNGFPCSDGVGGVYRLPYQPDEHNANTGVYAKLQYTLDGQVITSSHVIRGIGTGSFGKTFYGLAFGVNHTITVSLIDIWGATCAGNGWTGSPVTGDQIGQDSHTFLICALTISSFTSDVSQIDPGAGNIANLRGTIAGAGTSPTWTLDIKDQSGKVVQSFAGSGSAVSAQWDGKDGAGQSVQDGTYTATLVAKAGSDACTQSKSLTINVKNSCQLKITTISGSSETIDPIAGGSVKVSADIYDIPGASYTWEFTLPNGKSVSGSASGSTKASATWDGRNANGKIMKPEPGQTISATIILKVTDTKNPGCADSETKNVTISWTNDCKLQITFGSSANAASGNLSHSQPVFSTKGASLPTSITLYYNSLDSYNGPLGIGWTHNYNSAIGESSDGYVVLQEGDGGRNVYTKSGNGYISQSGDYSVLSRNTDGTFVVAQKDGTTYNFGTNGKIASIVDRNGNAMSFAYTNGNLITITDSAGRVTTIRYDMANHVASITDPSGNVNSFTVNNNTLTSVAYPGGGTWSYAYDAAFMLTKTDPNGNTTTYTYDDQHRVASSLAEGNTRLISYPTNTGTTKTTTFTETDGGVWQYTYDTQAGTLTQKTDPQGGVTSYTYDGNRNTLSTTEPDGSATTYTYDASGNMASVTDALGQTTSYTYNTFGQVLTVTDSQGNTTTNGYDEKGNLTSTTDATGATTSYEYDTQGHVTKMTNPVGQSTEFTYDQSGNLSSVTDPTGATTSFTYDAAGNVTSQTDANGNTTRFEYDSDNRLTKVTDPAGNVTTFGYDKNGNRTSQTDANGNVTRFEYNAKGQLIKAIDALGNSTTYTYGGAGCPSCGGGGDKLTSIIDANGNTTSYEYDQLGRKTKEIDALGNATLYSYDAKGNILTKTDANGHVTSFVYDPLGRVKEQTDALLGVVKFEYSPKGQVTKVVDALGNATDYEYDTAGRVIKTVSPDTGTTTYTYNSTGTLATITDAGNVTISYRYDALNRLTTIDFPTDVDIAYTYDDCSNGKGRVCTMTDQAGTTEYEYEKRGRIVKEKKTILGVTYTTSYSYDKAGTLKSITLPSGRQVTYTYDKVNRPAGVTTKLKNTTVLASSMAYDPASNLASITLGNGLTPSYTYNAARRISTIAVPGVMSLSYGYDPIGNITNITDAVDPAKSKTYAYDSLDRLASAMGPWGTLAWTYDANGNRLVQGNGVHYAYTYSANRLATVSNGHIDYYQYDNNGNTTNDGQKDFVYNQNQRLIRAELDGKTLVEYTYNANGQRVIKKTGPATTNSASSQNMVYHFDLNGKLIAETAGNGKMIAEYVYLSSQPLAMISKQANNERTYYYHNDHLGTPQKLTDATGTVVWFADYKPFGEATITESTITNNLRFPGQYYDAVTGLNYNYYRDYNPTIGRYIESDPIGIRRGKNHLYVYVANNPAKFTDPWGLKNYSNPDLGQFGPVPNAIYDFIDNYLKMRDANTIGADKYFHCMANCQAAKEGPVGSGIAGLTSECRELSDEHIKGDPRSACDADRKANRCGREGNPDVPCKETCSPFRPAGLDSKY